MVFEPRLSVFLMLKLTTSKASPIGYTYFVPVPDPIFLLNSENVMTENFERNLIIWYSNMSIYWVYSGTFWEVLELEWRAAILTFLGGVECLKRQATKMIQGMEHLLYEDRLREMRLSSLGKRSFWGDLEAAFQNLKGDCKKEDSFTESVMIEQGKMVLNQKNGNLNWI